MLFFLSLTITVQYWKQIISLLLFFNPIQTFLVIEVYFSILHLNVLMSDFTYCDLRGSVKSCIKYCNEVDMYGKKEAGTGEHLTFLITNKQTNEKRQPLTADCRTHKHKLKLQAWSSLVFQCRHSSFYSFRSSSVGLETGEWRRCRSLSFTPPASLRSHGSRPRPTRHKYILLFPFISDAAGNILQSFLSSEFVFLFDLLDIFY